MQVGPQHAAADLVHRMHHVMVVAPVDADVDKTQHVAHEDGPQRQQGVEAGVVRTRVTWPMTPALSITGRPSCTPLREPRSRTMRRVEGSRASLAQRLVAAGEYRHQFGYVHR